MAWWVWLWLAVIIFLTIAAGWDDVLDGWSPVRVALGAVANGICALSIIAFEVDAVAASMGKWLLPLALGAVPQLVADALKDMKELPNDPEFSEREDLLVTRVASTVTVAVLFGGAVLVGIVTGLRAW